MSNAVARRGSAALAALAILTLAALVPATGADAAVAQDWTQYLHDSGRSGYTADNSITAANAQNLASRPGWPATLGGTISTQPVVANGMVYSGAWDGYEYALTTAGKVVWKTALGRTTAANPNCSGTTGVASTAAVATVTVGSDAQPSSVLYVGGGGNDSVGGGNASLFALDAHSGVIRWKTVLGAAPATFMWSSPLVQTPAGTTVPSVYVGVSSYEDCPLIQGKLVQLDARTGAIQHQFAAVPAGCTGASIWGSPTYDSSDGSLYVATGNKGGCSAAEPYANAIVKLRASDLTVLSAWQVPAPEVPGDSDFGSAPTLFSGTVTSGGASRSLVGVGNKNGIFYVLNRASLAAGPVARVTISIGGDCPECGQGVIAPAAYDGSTVYVAGGSPSSGSSYKGVLRALNPNNLSAPRWIHYTAQPILAAVAAAPGIVVIGEGNYTLVMNAATGATVDRQYRSTGTYYGAPTISGGVLYEGDSKGVLFAYSVGGV